MADELVHYTVDKGVATITLDSPHNRNALSAQLRRELRHHLTTALTDDAARVIVLDHTGPVFCSGMDLKEAGNPDTNTTGVNEFPEILTQLWTSPKPVVAKLAGPARAGGVGIVAAADIAIAADTATFAFTEVRLGLVPAVISVTVLPRLLPRAAHELFLTGEKFDAQRAVAIGLLNKAVPPTTLNTETTHYTTMLTQGAPKALAATKTMLRRPKPPNLTDDFKNMLDLSATFFASPEAQEGIRAFTEKRPPTWSPTQ